MSIDTFRKYSIYTLSCVVLVTGVFYFWSQKYITNSDFENLQNIKIGVILPENTKDEYSRGIRLAEDEINRSGGVLGKKISVETYIQPESTYQDVRLGINDLLKAAHHFANDNSIIGVLSTARSESAAAAAPVLQKKNKILITTSATDSVINKMGYENLFSMQIDDYDSAEVIVHHAAEKNLHNFVIISDETLQSIGLTTRFSAILEDSGGKVLFVGSGHQDKYKFDKATIFLVDNPMFDVEDIDAILLVSSSPQHYAYAIRRLRQLNIFQPIYAPRNILSNVVLDEFKNDQIDQVYVVSPYDQYYTTPLANVFFKNFEKKYLEPPAVSDEEAYTGVKLLASAINNTKSINSKELSNYLRSMRYIEPFSSPAGNLVFDSIGRVTETNVFVLEFNGSKMKTSNRYFKPFNWKKNYENNGDSNYLDFQ